MVGNGTGPSACCSVSIGIYLDPNDLLLLLRSGTIPTLPVGMLRSCVLECLGQNM